MHNTAGTSLKSKSKQNHIQTQDAICKDSFAACFLSRSKLYDDHTIELFVFTAHDLPTGGKRWDFTITELFESTKMVSRSTPTISRAFKADEQARFLTMSGAKAHVVRSNIEKALATPKIVSLLLGSNH